jgi:hypothetical protein
MKKQKTTHTPIYFAVRSAVRFLFWGCALSALTIGVVKVSEMGDKPECDVHLNFNFTWNTDDFASLNPNMTLNDCRHPDDVILSMDGTWDWIQEK